MAPQCLQLGDPQRRLTTVAVAITLARSSIRGGTGRVRRVSVHVLTLSGRSLVVAMCLGQVGNLLPHVVVPAIMAQHLIPLWGLTGAQAGFMASCYSIGYMLAVPVLGALTDRIDARYILVAGSALSAAATLAFGMFADGMWSACALWAVAGTGFAGAYMPGLRAMTDRLPAGDISRSITYFTGSFSFGVGLSFLAAQLIADAFGWRAAFLVTGLGPLIMLGVSVFLAPHVPAQNSGRLLDFRPVLRNRKAMAFILGYGVHCFELYGMRTWLVPFWTFVTARSQGGVLVDAVTVSVLFTLIAMPASIAGNEAALRIGRHRAIAIFQVASVFVALALAVSAGGSAIWLLVLLLLYAITLPIDSGALTSGMTMAADPKLRGATMAMHSMVGFGMSAAGSWGFGVALDAAGGTQSPSGWFAGFVLLAFVIATGPAILAWSRKGAAARD